MTAREPVFTAHEADRIRTLDGVPLASFGRRFAAFVLDMAVVAGAYTLVGLPGAVRHRTPGGPLTVHFNPFHGLWGPIALVLYFALATYIGRGQTPGKRLLGIRVVSTAHEHLSLWHCVERSLGYAASALEAGFGFLQYFIHPNRRTVHDRIAETVVVRERRTRA